MADFQETARLKIKDLSSKNASVRRAAAYYLGEAGVDEAITKLATVYKNDPDASVRKAAAYSLGMFRAVEEALARGEEEKVVGLLRAVVEEDKFGRRLKTPKAALARIVIMLLIALIVLVVMNVAPLPGLKPIPGMPVLGGEAVAAALDRDTVVAQMRQNFTAMRNDTNTLQMQFQQVLVGGALDCNVFFNNAPTFELTAGDAAAYPDLVQTAGQLADVQIALAAGKARYEADCFGNQPLQIAEVGGLLAGLRTTGETLTALEASLNPSAVAVPDAQTATVSPTATDAAVIATETPLVTDVLPTPTVAVANPRVHLVPLYNIIDDVIDPRGPGGLLKQYWTDASTAGTTRGCTVPPPPIPANYELPAEDAALSVQLVQAVSNINLGLQMVREGWASFQTGCASGELGILSQQGLQKIAAAEEAFRVGDELLAAVRNGA